MIEELDQLRQQYQPETVQIIFITKAIQPGKVFFYRRNSNVFRAIKEAFSQVLVNLKTMMNFNVF